MKLFPKNINVFIAILFALLLVSCSNSNEEPVARSKSNEFPVAAKSFFVTSRFHFALPKGYSVDSFPDYEFYHIRTPLGDTLMTFTPSRFWHDWYPVKFSHPENPNEFSEVGRLDSVRIFKGEKTKYRSVYISSNRILSKGEIGAPYETLEFIYYPDQVDTAICENIIRSAKIHSYNKNYLCSIYMPDNDSLGGVTMSKLRNLHIKDIQTFVKDIELLPAVSADQDFFEKNGKYLFLADCFMGDEYKGSFHINESCEIGWNGKYAEKTDAVDLLMAMDNNQFKEKLMKKCQVNAPPELPHNCSKLYKLNIHYSKNDVPQAFDFTYHSRSKYLEDEFVISPIQAAIDYDGFVQLRVDGKISEFPISYVDPGEEKKLDESKIKNVNRFWEKQNLQQSLIYGVQGACLREAIFSKGNGRKCAF